MTTAELTTDPFFDFREKLTIMFALEMITLNQARRLLTYIERRYPNGNAAYCEAIVRALKSDPAKRRF